MLFLRRGAGRARQVARTAGTGPRKSRARFSTETVPPGRAAQALAVVSGLGLAAVAAGLWTGALIRMFTRCSHLIVCFCPVTTYLDQREQEIRARAEVIRVRAQEKEEAKPEFKFNQAVAACSAFLDTAAVEEPQTEGTPRAGVLPERVPVPLLVRSDLKAIKDLVVHSGKFLLLVGESGYAKSTSAQLALSSAGGKPAIYVKFRKVTSFWERIANEFGVPFGASGSQENLLAH
jgi:hypothetical protein